MTHPGGPHGSPPPGPAGPGWGGAWAPPPQPPQPGVIPLRPLALSDILNGTFSAFGRYWKPLLGTAVLAYGAALLVTGAAVAIGIWANQDTFHAAEAADRANDDAALASELIALAVGFGVVAVVGMVCMLLATAVTQAASPAVLQEAVLGRPATFGVVWRRAVNRAPAVIGVLLIPWLVGFLMVALLMTGYVALMLSVVEHQGGGLANVLAGVGLITGLLLMPVAIWLWTLFSLAPAVAVFESASPMRALRRSARLVKGSWWRIFGITLLVYAMAMVAGSIIQVPFSFLGMFSMIPSFGLTTQADESTAVVQVFLSVGGYVLITLLGSFVSQIITTFFPQLSTGLLYVDQRIRRENLAPALAEAAHLPPPPPYQQPPQHPQHPQH
ncbi:hypothetical protein OG897_11020 [Streptomyces sp. NBC_00237]|uniref:hypothetical protein n=1 Tax=Streptomyces sp. NBC_00237 TaxID=2975687 RepID=UPI00224FE197|nr:hypothetical protein [Streptomyces sp. NBC_00237]MCX5201980.1 hypothetical protein [Streptomyces sp. NBC_00237]